MSNIFEDTISTNVSIHHAETMTITSECVDDEYFRTRILIKAKDGNDMDIVIYSKEKIT